MKWIIWASEYLAKELEVAGLSVLRENARTGRNGDTYSGYPLEGSFNEGMGVGDINRQICRFI